MGLKNILEVGDVIYFAQYSSFKDKGIITRVTPKRAYIKVHAQYERQFNREITSQGSVEEIGVSGFGREHAYIETEELKAKWDEKILRTQLEKKLLGHAKFTLDQVKSILAIINERLTN